MNETFHFSMFLFFSAYTFWRKVAFDIVKAFDAFLRALSEANKSWLVDQLLEVRDSLVTRSIIL